MTFMEALELMKQGKKVRRPVHTEDYYICLNENDEVCDWYGYATFDAEDFEATDWEEWFSNCEGDSSK